MFRFSIWTAVSTAAQASEDKVSLQEQEIKCRETAIAKGWKETSGYHMRSLAETSMFRFKTIFGDHLSARLLETQTTQAIICCAALNRMTHLGMPESYKVSPSGKAA